MEIIRILYDGTNVFDKACLGIGCLDKNTCLYYVKNIKKISQNLFKKFIMYGTPKEYYNSPQYMCMDYINKSEYISEAED